MARERAEMFADFSKEEFIKTAVGGTSFIILGYLIMMGLLVVIS
jgi:hypothetical protein